MWHAQFTICLNVVLFKVNGVYIILNSTGAEAAKQFISELLAWSNLLALNVWFWIFILLP